MLKNSAITFAVWACLASAFVAPAQGSSTAQEAPSSAGPITAPVEQNLNEYIDLIRKDVRSQKSAVMDAVMQLDPDQAAKFWPIYRDYEADLAKGSISVTSPLARSLIGKQVGDEVKMRMPGGERTYEVLDITFG